MPRQAAKAPRLRRAVPTGHLGGVASVWNQPAGPTWTGGKVSVGSGLLPAARAAPAPAAQAPAASPNGDISTADPRDATYGAGLAGLLGQIQTQRQAVQAADATDQQGYNENLGRIAKNRAGSVHDANVTSSHQGLAFSGILGKRVGDTNAQYDDQVNQNSSALAGRQAQRALQLQEIGNLTADPNSPYSYSATGGAGLSFYNLLRDAADRRTQAALTEAPPADDAAPAPDAVVPALPQPAAGKTTAKVKVKPIPTGRLGGAASVWNKPRS